MGSFTYTNWQRVFVAGTYTIVLMGAGYIGLKYFTPSREQLYKVRLARVPALPYQHSSRSPLRLLPRVYHGCRSCRRRRGARSTPT